MCMKVTLSGLCRPLILVVEEFRSCDSIRVPRVKTTDENV